MTRTLLGLALLAASIAVSARSTTPSTTRLTALQSLGKTIFFDRNLSEPAGQSCASCHDPRAGFADPDRDQPTSNGANPVHFGNRNTPTAAYAAFSPGFHFDTTEKHYVGGQFLDGRAANLEEQAGQPLLNPIEMGNPDAASVVAKVRKAAYAASFESVFGDGALRNDELAFARVRAALAAFLRSPEVNPFSSKYDAYLDGRVKLTAREMRGLKVFEDEKKGNCAACHPSRPGPNGEPPLFTDHTYDNIGLRRNDRNPFYGMPASVNPNGKTHVDRGLGASARVNSKAQDGKFKVPTLRNVAITAPYFHNGLFTELKETVEFYNSRDVDKKRWGRPEVAANVNTEELGDLGLTDQEVEDIVAFMKTLTDGYVAPGK